ncbi:MAG: hypothetical protein KAI73_02090 [Rhodospirillaceae bacterium]|nr:hypothetical protein [Rhodospirillaceae bacterium]
MAKLNDAVTWALYEARIREVLEVPTGSAEDLQDLLDTATRAGDRYMNNPFVDDEGVDIATPRGALKGVWAYMTVLWGADGVGGLTPAVAGVKTGDLSESFGVLGGGFSPSKSAMMAGKTHWANFREKWCQ